MSIQSFVSLWRSWFLTILVALSLFTAAISASSNVVEGSWFTNSGDEHTHPVLAGDHQGGVGNG